VRTVLRLSAFLYGAALVYSQTVSLSNGIQLTLTANLGQPTGQETLTVDLAPASGDSFYRIFRDQNQVAVFAYELGVSRSGDAQFRITLRPAGNEFAAKFPNADTGKPTPTVATDRSLPLLRSGEHSDIDLFEIPGMGLKVSDSIQISLNDRRPRSGAITFTSLRVAVNQHQVSNPGATVAGRYAMFYIPGRGGYFFSTDAVPGKAFVPAGTVDQNRMQFDLEGDSFDCVSATPIFATLGGAIWVYHDPNYKPAGNWTKGARETSDVFFIAAADTLSWWLP